MILTSGKNLILDRLFNLSSAVAITSMGVGDSSVAAAVGQTGLQGTTNVLIGNLDAGTSRTGSVVTATRTFTTSEANFAINELGLFNGNTNNTSTMLDRIVLGGTINKTSAISVVFVIQITQS